MGKWEYHRTQVGLGLKQSSLGGTFYPNVSKNHIGHNIYRNQQQLNSASLSTGEDRVVHSDNIKDAMKKQIRLIHSVFSHVRP